MSNRIREWRQQHDQLRRLLDLLAHELASIRTGEDPRYELLLDLLFYLTRYPDRFHHPEEDALFDRIWREQPSLAPRVEALHRQHGRIAESGSRLLELVETVVDGTIVSRVALLQSGTDYIAEYHDYMRHEELELFPIVEAIGDQLRDEGVPSDHPDPLFGEVPAERFRQLNQQIADYAQCECTPEPGIAAGRP